MLKIGIIPNLGKAECPEVFEKLCGLVGGKAKLMVTDEVFELPGLKAKQNRKCLLDIAERCNAAFEKAESFFEKADIIVVMGGDGSILRAASGAAKAGKPLLGINLGRVGYLASAEKGSLEKVAEKLLSGDYKICEHIMLSTRFEGCETFALNDVVVSRSETGRILEFSLYVDDEFVDKYTADGMVIATPTGSTAYSLSAGGPIAYPYMDMLLITPVCPHGLNSRPIVVPADKKITLRLGDKYDEYKAIVTADGQIIHKVSAGDFITVSKASVKTELIKMNNYGFYDLLRIKLKGN